MANAEMFVVIAASCGAIDGPLRTWLGKSPNCFRESCLEFLVGLISFNSVVLAATLALQVERKVSRWIGDDRLEGPADVSDPTR